MFNTLNERFKKKFKDKNPLLYYTCLLISFCIMIQWVGFVLHGVIVTANTLCNTHFGQAFLYGTFLNECAAVLLFFGIPMLMALFMALSAMKNNPVLLMLSMGLTILFSILISLSVSIAVVEVFGTVCGWVGLADIKSATMFGTTTNLISAACLCCVYQIVNRIGKKTKDKKKMNTPVTNTNQTNDAHQAALRIIQIISSAEPKYKEKICEFCKMVLGTPHAQVLIDFQHVLEDKNYSRAKYAFVKESTDERITIEKFCTNSEDAINIFFSYIDFFYALVQEDAARSEKQQKTNE